MQIQQFNSEQVEKYKAVFTFIGQIAPQLAEDVKNIDRINNKNILTSDTSYMYNKHDYFGAYDEILAKILQIFNNDSIVKLLVAEAKQNNEEDTILDNIDKYRTIAEKCKKLRTLIIWIKDFLKGYFILYAVLTTSGLDGAVAIGVLCGGTRGHQNGKEEHNGSVGTLPHDRHGMCRVHPDEPEEDRGSSSRQA